MKISLQKFLRVRREEQPLLLLMVAALCLFQFCQIINENFAETVFLKRFGVNFLPNAFFFNSLVFLFLLMWINAIIDRMSRSRLVTLLLLIFACVLCLLRLLIVMHAPLTYPIIYIAIKQMKYLFFVVFWALASDIYSTRKARRAFPLIGGGGVVGCIVGSTLSLQIAETVGTNNMLLFSAAGMLCAYVLLVFGRRQAEGFTPISFSPEDRLSVASFGKFLRRELGQMRGTSLLGFLVVLALLPGFVTPLFEYIFNYLADKTYAGEDALLEFFGIFKGSFNACILLSQIFIASGLFRRYGIVNVLFAHPVGYLLAFGGLYFRFRMPVAIMGKAGLEVIDGSLYKPGAQMLFNIIPAWLRGRVNVLVQGATRRAGDLAGSGLLTLVKDYISPANLTLLGPFFAALWLYFLYRLRGAYFTILYQSLREKHVDFSELEEQDLRSFITGKARSALSRRLADENPATALMAAKLLAQSDVPGWPGMLSGQLPRRDAAFQVQMLGIIATAPSGEGVVPALIAVAAEVDPSALPDLLRIVRHADPERGEPMFRQAVTSGNPRVVAESLLGLKSLGEKVDYSVVEAMLDSDDVEKVLSGVYLLGEIGNRDHLRRLLPLAVSDDSRVRAECALSLGKLGLEISSEVWMDLLHDGSARVRLSAVEGLAVLHVPEAVAPVIPLLGDEDGAVREAARILIEGQGEAAIPILTRALSGTGLIVRNALVRILDNLGMKEHILLKFIDGKIEEGYRMVGSMKAVEDASLGRSGELLSLLLRNKFSETTDEVLRMLSLLVKSGRMQFVLESYYDRDETVREHALEALETMLTRDLSRSLMPLLEDSPIELKLEAGRRCYRIRVPELQAVFRELLGSPRNAEVVCCLMCLKESCNWGKLPISGLLLEKAQQKEKSMHIRGGTTVEELMERVLTLRGIPIFTHLNFKELLAVGSICQEERFYAGDAIIKEGERGYTMYVITSGRVRIVSRSGGEEVQLALLKEGDYFGEMALFDDSPRSATAVAEGDVRLLRINKREFRDMLREYPGVSIMMCEEFCRRLRRTIERVNV
jgi:hypothetical protein